MRKTRFFCLVDVLPVLRHVALKNLLDLSRAARLDELVLCTNPLHTVEPLIQALSLFQIHAAVTLPGVVILMRMKGEPEASDWFALEVFYLLPIRWQFF